jgi:hypothetical protein
VKLNTVITASALAAISASFAGAQAPCYATPNQAALANQRAKAALLLALLQARARNQALAAQPASRSAAAVNQAIVLNRAVQAQADSNRQRQAAAVLTLLRARAAAAPSTPSPATFDTTGDAAGLINRLNSMSQADVNRLMSKPSMWDQLTPSWLKKSGGNVLGAAGVPSGLLRDVSRLDNLADPAANARVDKQMRTVQKLGGISAGMAVEQKVRNSVQREFYKDQAVKSFDDINRGLTEVEARTGIGR